MVCIYFRLSKVCSKWFKGLQVFVLAVMNVKLLLHAWDGFDGRFIFSARLKQQYIVASPWPSFNDLIMREPTKSALFRH